MSVVRKRSNINLSRNSKLTCKAGRLIPFLCEKVMPNDVIGGKTDIMIRIAPQMAPVLDNMKVKMYYFYCPTRLLNPKGEEEYEDWFSNQGNNYYNLSYDASTGIINHDTEIYKYRDFSITKEDKIRPIDYNKLNGVFQHFNSTGFVADTQGNANESSYTGNYIDHDLRRYGILRDGDVNNQLNPDGTFGIPIAYPHFDTTLPKMFVIKNMSDDRGLSVQDFDTNWLSAVPYFGGVLPYFTECGSLADYFGVAIGPGKWNSKFNIFPFLMYRRVFNEFFRDPLKRDPLPEELHDYKDCFASLFSSSKASVDNYENVSVGSINTPTIDGTGFPVLFNSSYVDSGDTNNLFGVFGLGESYSFTGRTAGAQAFQHFGFNIEENPGLFLYDKDHYKNCFPLIDPCVFGEYIKNYYDNLSYSSSSTTELQADLSAYTVGGSQSQNFSRVGLLPVYSTNDIRNGNFSPTVYLNGINLISDKIGANFYGINEDSDLNECGRKLAENYSIFNDVLYKPAKRNIWNTCICDPSYMGQKFVVPVDSQGVNFDYEFGATTEIQSTGLDLRELKVYSRIGLFYNFLAWTGPKYEDQMYMIYGVTPSDLRMKHPKFIGSSESNIIFSEVINTAGGKKNTDTESQQGTTTGYAFGSARRNGFSYHTKEEGYVLGLLCIEPRGRDYSRTPRCLDVPNSYFDIPNPFFDGIGNTEVKIKDFMNSVMNGMIDPQVIPSEEDGNNFNGVISGYFDIDRTKYVYDRSTRGNHLQNFGFRSLFLGDKDAHELLKLQFPGAGSTSTGEFNYLHSPFFSSAYMCSEFVDNKTFGYQKQYFEYRNSVPELHGEYLLSKRDAHLTRFFNELVPDIDEGKRFTNINNSFGAEKYIGLSKFATDMVALDTYRYNSVDRLFDLNKLDHPFWIDLEIDIGVSRIIGNGGISLV